MGVTVLLCAAAQDTHAAPCRCGQAAATALAHGVSAPPRLLASDALDIGECSVSDTKLIGIPCFEVSISVLCRSLRFARRQLGTTLQLALASSLATYLPTLEFSVLSSSYCAAASSTHASCTRAAREQQLVTAPYIAPTLVLPYLAITSTSLTEPQTCSS